MAKEVKQLTEKDIQALELKAVTNVKDKNEKLSWTRRQKRVNSIVEEKLNPLSMELLRIQEEFRARIDPMIAERIEIMDELEILRAQMVKECIHPLDHLIHKGTHIECKFCNVKLSKPRALK